MLEKSIQRCRTPRVWAVVQAPKESLFSVALCSCVPEMVANIMHGSSPSAISRAIVAAIRQQVVNDPELRRQHKAAAAIYRQRNNPGPAQVLLPVYSLDPSTLAAPLEPG